MKTTKYILTLVLAFWSVMGNLYAVEKSYYNSIDGKSGKNLFDAVHTVAKTGYKGLTYDGLWTAYCAIDINSSGKVWDMYSNATAYTCGGSAQGANYSKEGDSYNREHSIPKSWFGGTTNASTPGTDLFHVVPTDGYVNNRRSNYAFGEVASATYTSQSGCKLGSPKSISISNSILNASGSSSQSCSQTPVFEPMDEYKGDFARGYFGTMIKWANGDYQTFTTGDGAAIFNTAYDAAHYYGLTGYGVALLLKWHREDPVSQKEIDRNDGIQSKQGNRNPFIDLPDLVEYLWGNHAGETVDLSGLTIATGGGSVPTPYELTLNRHGVTQTLTCKGTYTLPTASTEEDACGGWEFKGWTTSNNYSSTTAPNYTTTVSAAATLYAVYGNTTSSAPSRATMASATYNKVTSTDGITDGQYLIVYETGKVAFDGSLTTLDATSNTVSVTISNSSITGDFAANEFTISKTDGAILSASGKYIGNASNSNGLTSSNNKLTNTLSISNDGNFVAKSSGGAYLCYNNASDQKRFRYFKSSSYTSQQAIQLYKNSSGGGGGSTTTYKTSPDCGSLRTITLSNSGVVTGGDFMANVSSAYPGATITLAADPDPGYEFGSWSVTKQGGGSVTVTNNQFSMPDANVIVSATFNALTRYNIRFFNNGNQIGSTQSVYVGGTPNIPADPEGCDGYTFVGWYTSSLAADNTTSYTWVTDFTVSAAQDYYAVFAHTEGGGGSSNGSQTFTFSSIASANSWENGVAYTSIEIAPVTIIANGGGNNGKWYTSGGGSWRMYSGGTVNISVESGSVTSVTSSPTCTFTISNGNASFSPSDRTDFTSITVNYTASGSGTTYYTSTTSCASACTTLATPEVTAKPGNGQITLTWPAVADADHYTVTISSGVGFTTECGSAASIGEVAGTNTKTCVITGLTNRLEYTTTVVANATSATCDSEADTDTATPQDCTPWADPTLSWNMYSLNTTTNKTATKTLSGITHGTLSFESSNTEVLTVNSSTGAVTAVGAGSATVTAQWTAAGGYCEKSVVSQEFEVAGPLTISFDANGGSGTMTAQTMTYKAAEAIQTNTFTRTGYTFQGWALTADGEKTYDDKQSVAFTNSLTLYAVWQLNSHDVSFSSPAGATVTVNNQSSSPQSIAYGSTVTIRITPAEHYTITSVAVSGASGNVDLTGTGETRTFTMPDENVTVTVSMAAESQYTATFYNGAVSFATVNGYVDDDINAPAGTPASCDDDEFTFIGWVTMQQTTEATTHPEIISFPQTMPTGGVSYYALFRRSEGGGGGEASVTFITAANDGNTAYTDDSGIKENLVESSSGIASFEGDKLYVGKSGVKLGVSNNVGYITLTLSSAITTDKITVIASKYGTDNGDLEIEVNGSTAFGEAKSPADGTLEFTGDETEISSLTISTTAKRAYIASVSLGGGGTSYYTTAPACVPCENQVTLTKGAESNGTFTLDKVNGTYDNCKKNFSVTVSAITPETDYYCTGVTATGGAHVAVVGPDGSGNYTINYAKGNSITSVVTANFAPIPTYTVTWSIDGDESRTEEYKEGDAIDFSHNPGDCSSGKKFMGWSAVEVDEQDEAPEYVTSATMATSPITYYAVFAEETSTTAVVANEWTRITDISQLTDGATVMLVQYYNDQAINNTPGATSCTANAEITNTNTALRWTAVKSGTKWKFKTSANKYLSTSALDNNTTLALDATYDEWTITADNGGGTGSNNTYNNSNCFILNNGSDLEYYSSTFKLYTWSLKYSSAYPFYIYIQKTTGSTTYTGYTTSCVIPDNVTVTFNANGGTGTMTDQTISYNTSTRLKPNEFTREGYTFQGWATTADGSVAYDDKSLVTFKRRTTTLYAVWAINSYTITLVQPSGGTVSSSPAGSAEYGAQVMIMVTPDSHHTFSSITVTKNSGGTISLSGSGATQSFTMPADNVTVTASLNVIPTYTVTWSADGDETNQAQYIEGESIVFPATAEGCEGKTFVGWSATQFAETDDAPELVTSAEMGTSDLIYYAVYADASSGGGGSGNYELVVSDPGASNWDGDYLIAYDGETFADGRTAGTDGMGKQYASVNPEANLSGTTVAATWGDMYNVTIEQIGSTGTYLLKTKDGNYNYQTSNANGLASTANKSTAENYPLTITLNNSGNVEIAISAGAVFHYNTSGYFRFYKDGGQSPIYLYKKGGSAVSYSGYTTSCGASISARNGQWITSANGQKVKTVLRVSAKNFDEATTLSASSSNSNFALSLAETAVPATAAGLTTDFTIEYTPASADVKESSTITLMAGAVTKTITVNGRSLPDEFLILTKKAVTWYALPANMTSGSKQYEGVVVTPNNNTTPTAVSVSPSTLVYSLKSVADARYASAGQSVRLIGNNNLCLWGEVAADETGIQNNAKFSNTNGANTDWLLTTTDGVHYQIANPNHADYATGRQLSFGLNFGQYEQETELYFVSTGCNSQPQDVHVSARRNDATFSWVSNAAEMHIDVYSDESMTALVKSATATAVPYYMDGLTQETDYWYRLTPNEDTDCAVTGLFHTSGPTIDVVEWKEDTVVILVDKPEDLHPKIVIAGEVEHGVGSGVTATELFFSKYFEGAGSMKLIAIFNGTNKTISLSKYKIINRSANSDNVLKDNGAVEYDLSSLGSIESGEEIILFSPPLASSAAEEKLVECSADFIDAVRKNAVDNEKKQRWIECDGTTFSKMEFNGNDAMLLTKNGDMIDIIGAIEMTNITKNCRNENSWQGTAINMDYGKTADDFPEIELSGSETYADYGIDFTNETIDIYTARCILFRNKDVTSGKKAVALNTSDFVTLGTHTYQDVNYSSEWNGRSVCVTTQRCADLGWTFVGSDYKTYRDNSAATCNSYQDLGAFDYSKYYKDWSTIGDGDQSLSNYVIGGTETGTENLYELPIENLSQYSCLNLQFILLDAGDTELSRTQAQVPILVKGSHATNDAIFNEIMKTDGGVPLYDESIDRCKTCEVLLLNGATLTKASDDATHDVARFKDITLYPGSKLIVPSATNFTVNTMTCRVEGDDVPLTELAGNLMTESQKLIVTRRITNDRYYFLSMPYDCRMADIRLANGAPATNGVNFRLLEYDAEARAEEGSRSGVPGHWKLATGTMKAGQGYAIAVSSTKPKEIMFPMTIPSKNLTNEERTKVTNTVDILEYVGAARHTNYNWNLIAHPYITKFVVTDAESVEAYWENPSRENTGWVDDWKTWDDPTQSTDSTYTHPTDSTYTPPTDSTATTIGGDGSPTEGNSPRRAATPPTGWTESPGGIYVTRPTVTDGKVTYEQLWINAVTDIPPFTAMFIQGDGRGEMTFNMYPASPAPKRNARASRYETKDHTIFVGVSLHSTNGMSDLTSLRLRPDFGEHYKFGQDLLKFTVFNTSRPQLYIKTPDDQLAFRAISDSLAEHSWIPVGVYCRDAGEYTFSLYDKYVLDEIEAVYLHDNVTGITTNLLYGNYKIETTKQLYTNTRFTLNVILRRKVEVDTPTMIDHTEDPNAPRKFFRDGVMYIMRDGKIYDLTGKPAELDKLMLNR